MIIDNARFCENNSAGLYSLYFQIMQYVFKTFIVQNNLLQIAKFVKNQ